LVHPRSEIALFGRLLLSPPIGGTEPSDVGREGLGCDAIAGAFVKPRSIKPSRTHLTAGR
jgi:hypothetical protein